MRVIISAGGTGGHIYPAISIINKIKAEEPDSEFLYIGTDNRMESEIIPKLGIDFRGITIYGFKRKLTLDNFKTLHYFLKARRTCKGIIREFNPDIVIGCGGYVTAPVIWAGKKLGKKTFIHEQNSVVGLSNRYLTKYADRIGVCFESVMKEFPRDKVVLTGNPCSEEALRSKKASKKEFGLTEGKKLILIVMGSLGSGSISDMFISFLKDFGDKDYEVLFVSGKGQYDKFRDIVLPSNVKVVSFIENLPRVMKIADIMVTRAGASTISEIMAIDTVSIFIPSPYVTNNHQEMNAMDLVNKKAGRMIREADLNKETLFSEIDSLFNNRKEYEEIKRNLREYGIKDSGSRIYETLKDLMMSDKRFF